MIFQKNNLNLSNMAKKRRNMLTLELSFETLAEFGAGVKIMGATSNASFLHQFVVRTIREAKQLVTPKEFEELVEKQRVEIQTRSDRKAKEARARISGEKITSAPAEIVGKAKGRTAALKKLGK